MMKKLTLFLLLCASCISAYSNDKRVSVGIRLGIHSSYLSNNQFSVSSRIGLNAGAYVKVRLVKRLFVQPQLDYFLSLYKYNRNQDNAEDNVNVHSIVVPVMVGYALIDRRLFSLSVLTGPALGFVLRVNNNDFGIAKDDYNTKNWSWRFEALVRVWKLSVHAGYEAGISKYSGDVRNRTWFLGLGFRFF